MVIKPDLAIIRRTLDTFKPGTGEVLELRALHVGKKKYTANGYFDGDHLDAMAGAAFELSEIAEGVYFTLNPVKPELLARACNRVVDYPKATTQDPDITRRRYLPLDFDPKRPTGISSSKAEKALALERCRRCYKYLDGQGWRAPIIADSGNGYHLLYPIGLPNDDDSRKLIERTLKVFDGLFGDESVDLDVKNFNAARIWKLYGTLARKGDHMPERPHRVARMLETLA
jgi:hypothetical protein